MASLVQGPSVEAMVDNNLAVGTVVSLPFVDEAGLRTETEIPFLVRNEHAALWHTLERTSCFLEGPPGSGKSTAVLLWLLRRVFHSGRSAVWLHFNKIGGHELVYIQRANGLLVFERILEREPFGGDEWYAEKDIATCVVDGVTEKSLTEARKSWRVFGLDSRNYKNCHMIFVSSQQVLVGGEHLRQYGMERHKYFSWQEADIRAYAETFSPDQRMTFVQDVIGGIPANRLMPNQQVGFRQALDIKIWYFGSSARWIFGMTMKEALDDIENHVGAVHDARQVQSGLNGSRITVAVNHIITMYESDNPEKLGEFSIASSFILDQLSDTVGLEAIKLMYRSHWVISNPSVHGLVFEWDILTRLQKFKHLALTDPHGNEITWTITKYARLAEFSRNGVTADRLLVCPEKWNHPEYDGMYIYRDQGVHLVAWNASEATMHSGRVSKLVTMLEAFSQRGHNAINFVSVRFLFLVPTDEVHNFQLPSNSDNLLARQQLAAWGFQGFEVFGTSRSE